MVIPDGMTGVQRIRTNTSLTCPSSSQEVNHPLYNERNWWSWRRCQYIVTVIKEREIQNANEWRRLAQIFQTVSIYKQAYIRSELAEIFSEASLDYLFGIKA